VDRNAGDSDRHNQRVENIYLNAGELPNRSSHDPRTAAIFRGVRWRTLVFKIYRAGDLHNKPGKPGIFNVGRTHFYDVIEPRLEKACLGDRAVGYTDRSVERVQAEMIAEGAAAPRLARIIKTAR
jgi:hypothetical protein